MVKKALSSEFRANIKDLHEEKESVYEFDVRAPFFKSFEESLINNSELKVKIILNKNVNVITSDFIINGTVELTCDSTLELFEYELAINERIFFKIGLEAGELDFNIYSINAQHPYIYFAQHIYDLITVNIPMKKVHSRFIDK
jgi:uncharacterized protein